MVKNSDFLRCKAERKKESFLKILQSRDMSSINMRAIPQDIVRTLSQDDLSRKMKITTPWGKSWEVEISRNPRFYYLEKSGWLKFVRDCGLGGDTELLTFTHQKDMWFSVNIFKKDGTEMVQPRESVAFLASSSRRCFYLCHVSA